MSSTLSWQPVRDKWRSLDCGLKWILQKKSGYPVDAIYDEKDLPYLQGLLDGGVKDAQKLIDAIEKHGEIHLKEIF